MKRFILALALLFPLLLKAQTYPVNSNGGNISSTNAACVPTACIGITVSNVGSISVTVTGTFSATLDVESSTDGSTFSSAGSSITSAGSSSYSASGLVLFRVRASAYTSGNPGVNITTSSQGGGGTVTAVTGTAPIVSSGGTTPAISCPTCLTSSSGVTSFNTRTGAITPQSGDYTATLVGLGNVTNDIQTKAAIVPNTVPTLNQALVGNGTAYVPTAISSNFVTSGLLADYQITSGDTVASLPDSSGNGNNATGTVGTAPTIPAGVGGLSCTGNGAVILPAALNSALTIEAYVSFQSPASPTSGTTLNAIVQGNGNGAASNANGLILNIGPTGAGNGTFQGASTINTYGGSVRKSGSASVANGNFAVAVTFGSPDLVYLNGKDEGRYIQSGNSAGLQTTGAYQLCGAAANSGLSSVSYFTGTILRIRFFNRVLTPAEIAQDAQAMQQFGIGRNFPPFLYGTSQVDQLAVLGDSIAGGNGQTPWMSRFTIAGAPSLNQTYSITDQAYSGQTYTTLAPIMDFAILPIFRPGATRNIFIPALGANADANDSATLGYMKQVCVQARAAGAKCLPFTMMSRTSADARKNSSDTLIRANWSNFADGLIDLASNPLLGADGASTNTTYFSDGLHPTQAGQDLMASIAARGINRAYGNKDFSSANTAVGYGVGTGKTINVQALSGGSGASPINMAWTTNLTAGSLVYCALSWSSSQNLTTFADSQTNSWSSVTAASTVGTQKVQAWYAPNVVGGADTINLTFSASTSNVYLACGEAPNIATSSPVDANSAIATVNGTSLTTASITTTQNNDFLVCYGFTFGGPALTITQGSPCTTRLQTSSTVAVVGDAIAFTTGSYAASATLSQSANFALGIVAFKGKAATTTVYNALDSDVALKCDATNFSVNIQLPTSVGMTGQDIRVKNVTASGPNTCTALPFGSETIDGASSAIIENNGTAIFQSVLVSSAAAGTNFKRVNPSSPTQLQTASSCSSGASPAVCGTSTTGAIAVPTGTNPTLVVNTTAVKATSQILLNVDESLTISGTTCNTTLSTLPNPVVTARTAGTSFTIQLNAVVATNPVCVSYTIIN